MTLATLNEDEATQRRNLSSAATMIAFVMLSAVFSQPAAGGDRGAALSGLDAGVDIEKRTNGPTNSNPTAPDFDNEDAPNGAGVPVLTPGSVVTWTYQVTNTGSVPFTSASVAIVDDAGTPGDASDDLSTTNGMITFQSVVVGDADNLLEPGEVWSYSASGTVGTGPYGNRGTVTVPGAMDFDLSHYTTPATATATASATATVTDTPTVTATSTATATVTDTPTVTATSTATATSTPIPQGGECTTASDCDSTFCVDGFCCDTACDGPNESCDLRPGTCSPTAAPAPALSTGCLFAAALVLCAIAVLALTRRRGTSPGRV